jgi:hypothetical protein
MDDAFTHFWRNRDHDVPCTPIGPEERHESGRVFVKVRTFEGAENFVRQDELVERPLKRADGNGADFADVTGSAMVEPRQTILRHFSELLEKAKNLDLGDDEALGEIIKAAVNARLSEAQVDSLISAGGRKTKISVKALKAVANAAREHLRRQDEAEPEARTERARIEAEKAERERIVAERAERERTAELERLYEAVKTIAESPTLLVDMEKMVHRLGVIEEGTSIRGTYLSATSRLMRGQVISYLRRGASSSGKNYLIGKTLDLFPSECIVRMSASSEKALAYMGDGPEDRDALKHKILLIPEAASLARKANGDEPGTANMLRTLLSEGRLDYPVVILERGGGTRTIHIVRDGPICAILTSARDNIEDELMNRLLCADADETLSLTRRVVSRAWIGDPVFQPPSGAEIAQWIEFQNWLAVTMPLDGYEAVIPFAWAVDKAHDELIVRDQNAGALRARRDVGAFVAAVGVSAVLHKAQREVRSNGAIVATFDDYRHAHEAFDAGMAAYYNLKSGDTLSIALTAIGEIAAEQGRINNMGDLAPEPESSQNKIEVFENDIIDLTVLAHFSGSRGENGDENFASPGEFELDGVTVVYCADAVLAEALIKEMVADAGPRPVAIDLEVAAAQSERDRVKAAGSAARSAIAAFMAGSAARRAMTAKRWPPSVMAARAEKSAARRAWRKEGQSDDEIDALSEPARAEDRRADEAVRREDRGAVEAVRSRDRHHRQNDQVRRGGVEGPEPFENQARANLWRRPAVRGHRSCGCRRRRARRA